MQATNDLAFSATRVKLHTGEQ